MIFHPPSPPLPLDVVHTCLTSYVTDVDQSGRGILRQAIAIGHTERDVHVRSTGKLVQIHLRTVGLHKKPKKPGLNNPRKFRLLNETEQMKKMLYK